MSTMLNQSAPLENYGHNLTVLLQQRAFSPLTDPDAVVVSKVFQVLQRKDKSNPVILDAKETRRWVIVAQVIRRMTLGDAPDPFCKQQVIALNYEALFCNLSDDDALNRREHRKQLLSSLGEKLAQAAPDSAEAWVLLDELFRWLLLEEWMAPTRDLARLQSMFVAMSQATGAFLLFVDHLHRLVGGERDKYPIDATTLLKPALARGQIQLIGACTPAQYCQYIERDAAMQRRCQEICLPN